MKRVTNTNLLFWVNLQKALTEHFLQGNIPLKHLLNAKPPFMSWRRSAFNEVIDWAPSPSKDQHHFTQLCIYSEFIWNKNYIRMIFLNCRMGKNVILVIWYLTKMKLWKIPRKWNYFSTFIRFTKNVCQKIKYLRMLSC